LAKITFKRDSSNEDSRRAGNRRVGRLR